MVQIAHIGKVRIIEIVRIAKKENSSTIREMYELFPFFCNSNHFHHTYYLIWLGTHIMGKLILSKRNSKGRNKIIINTVE